MDSRIIAQAARDTLEGARSFPEIIGLLIQAGVEYYHVDYATLRKTFYSPDGESVNTTITFENLPPIAADFDSAALRENIRDSQQNGQSFRDFTRRAMASGVQGYFAFIRGKRITYFGRQGDQHTEWFPQ